MFKQKFSRFFPIFLWLCVLLGLPATGKGQTYLWPTNASRLLTSSFCEFRPRHYHAAIDIKTWNRIGYRVVAVDEGHIMRVRVSAFGYGKALYLKLKDGNTAVYAHLNRFWPELDRFIDEYRKNNREYRVDLHFPAGKFPVKRGQLIGYTGKSGIGSPHLHFEIRDTQNRPVNPLLFYPQDFQDNIPPRLYELAIFPLESRALVNQRSDTLFFDLQGQTRFQVKDTLLFSGKIGLALKSYDQAQGASNQYSFYQARMWIDDSLSYSAQYDVFSYAQTEKVELDKNFSLWRRNKGIFHNFYRHPENNLTHYGDTPRNGGIIDSQILRKGLHRLRIQILDFAGNSADFEMNFQSGDSPQLSYDLHRWLGDDLFLRIQSPVKLDTLLVQSRDHSKQWSPVPTTSGVSELFHENIYYYTLAASPSNPYEKEILKVTGINSSGIPSHPLFFTLSESYNPGTDSRVFILQKLVCRGDWLELLLTVNHRKPSLLLSQLNKQIPEMSWFPHNERVYQINMPLATFRENEQILDRILGDSFRKFILIKKEEKFQIQSGDQRFLAQFPQGALYDDLTVYLEESDSLAKNHEVPSLYRRVGRMYGLQPFDQPVNEGIWISLTLPDSLAGLSGVGLYYWDHKKGWLFIPTLADSNPTKFSAKVTSMEKFVLIQDIIPPTIVPAQPFKNHVLHSQDGMYRFLVKDEFSGIQRESQIEVLVDDQWHLFEYDPEEDYITINIPGPGPHSLVLKVTDNSGNVIHKSFRVN